MPMFKKQSFSSAKHLGGVGRLLRFLSASRSTSMADNSHLSFINSNTQMIKVDSKFYISTLVKCNNLSQITQLHTQIIVNAFLHNLSVTNKLLYMYGQAKALLHAYNLFDGMSDRDAYSWSIMIGGFAKNRDFASCFRLFRDYIQCGVRPDNYTLPFVIRACRDTLDLHMGKLVHQIVCKCGLELDHFVCATLIDMYSKCRAIDDSRDLFDKMVKKDLVTWTVMIGGYTECGDAYESLVLFDRMKEEGVIPDKVAMVSVVHACAKLGAMHKASIVHDYIWMKKFSLDVVLGTAMIDMYAKCGNVDLARDIFDSMKERNVISWSVMIGAYGYHGQGKKALDLFPMMLRNGIFPNRITFVSLLYACSHTGLVEEGRHFFSIMREDCCIEPDVRHYTCMVDLLGRAGRLEEAVDLIEKMRVQTDEGLWGALLGACRIHKHVELAEKTAKHLLELEPQNPGHYVLLSNIYANAGNWENVANIRNLMSQRRLKKIRGWAWIEVDDKIYRFSVGDMSHERTSEIFSMLQFLSKKLELDTEFVLHDIIINHK